jgi:hypothetical protein
MSIAPETLAWLRQTAKFEGGVTAQAILHLLERVDALEQQPTCANSAQVPPAPEAAPVATDNGLLRCYAEAVEDALKRGDSHDEATKAGRRAIFNLGRQHGAAQPPTANGSETAQVASDAADKVVINCPETCWVEVRRAADGKVLYDNFRKGSLFIPVGEPPAAPAAPAGGLVERVCRQLPLRPVEARAAIREVAAWLDLRGMRGCALWLREEMDR